MGLGEEVIRVWNDSENFEAILYVTPFSSGRFVYYTVALYLITIFSIQFLLKIFRIKGFRLDFITAIHNLFLCFWSLVMFLGVLYDFSISNQSLYELTCVPLGTRFVGRLYFWFYMFYVSKIYELLDTVILVFRRKPLSFLHVFHHAIVLVQFWSSTTGQAPPFILFGPILINTFVHIIMYFYFFLCAIGSPPGDSWKKRITQLQMVQFVVDATFPLSWPLTPGMCYGKEYFPHLLLLNESICWSFFFLFLNFYKRAYRKRPSTIPNQKKIQ